MDYFTLPFFLPVIYIILKWIFIKLRRNERNKPPLVPGGIPFIGNVIGFDRKKPHITLSKWSRIYGDVFRIKLFGEEIVVLNSTDAIKEAIFNKGNVTAGRPNIFRLDFGFHYSKDVIFGTFTPKWIDLKKLITKSLKDYGTNCEKIELIVKDEIVSLCQTFSDYGDVEFDPSVEILTAVVNCLSAPILGKRFPRGDPQLYAYKRITRLFSEACSPIDGAELDIFPWLRFFGNNSFRKLVEARDSLDQWIDTEMIKAKGNFRNGNSQCIFDAFYQAHKDSTKGKQLNDNIITEEDVRNLFVDMLVSSTFTTAVAINAFCLFMASFPELQENIRKQLVDVFGQNELPDYDKRHNVPLMEATVFEVLRYISHVPLSLPHFTMEDTTIGGYVIPKNRKILLNLWNVHHNEALWIEPWKFNPMRFLDKNGDLVGMRIFQFYYIIMIIV